MARHVSRRKKSQSRTLWRIVLLLWTLIIWTHSLFPGAVSSGESGMFVRLLSPFFGIFGITDQSLMQLIVRKSAHFTEYAILAALCTLAFDPHLAVPLWPAVMTVLMWIGVPLIDETIQKRVPGRAGTFTDALIDMAGFAAGLVIMHIVLKVLEKRRREQAERERRERQRRAAAYRRKAREAAYQRAGKPLPPEDERRAAAQASRQAERPRGGYQPKHAQQTPPRGKHARIEPEPDANRQRFSNATRK